MTPSPDTIICRCEELTVREILDAVRSGAHDVDAVKRHTRAGMGLCQGRSCSRLVRRLIADELGVPVQSVRLSRTRIPVRPVPARAIVGCGEE
jgi:NAD(P)H-nitrite reductase large subunit